MCNFSGRLVAWMDGELAEPEAEEIERHVAICGECRGCISACENASRDFAAYYQTAARAAKPPRRLPRWVPIVAATAATAAIALLALIPRSAKQVPAPPQVTIARPPVAVEPAIKPLTPVHRAHATAHRKAPTANWAMAEPAIQIAIPADAMFPPGAVPEGVNFVANLSLADGSVQAIRLQP
jgi:Putative zinc-finger